MKQILALVMSAFVLLGLCACGSQTAENSGDGGEAAVEQTQ